MQCTGLTNAAYPGSGTSQPCAWDHPFRALPPGGTVRISGGDTLIIAEGSYKMGYGAPGAGKCDRDSSYDCTMPAIPSGPSPAQPTRILGTGWDSGCSHPPELWGSERPWFILNLTDASNVEIACFEITDHSGCVEGHSGSLACKRNSPPYGNWAAIGLYAEDSTNVLLRDLNIHGLAAGGVHAGRLTDWTVENVRIAANGWVGWDGDLWDDAGDSNSGTLTFRHWLVEWNGCGETYPGGKPTGCWGQEAGGYGDGAGTGATGGNWVIEDSAFLHNTSDGLDLLYHSLGGTVRLNRVRAEGNAGNQVKVAGQTQISNSVLTGNCAFFVGKPYAYWVDHCRALGNTLELAFTGGEQMSITNSTFYGQGDGLVGGGPRDGFACNGSEKITARNNIFLGDEYHFNPGDMTFLFYQEGCSSLKLNSDYNVIHRVKDVTCGGTRAYVKSGMHDLCQNPILSGPLSGTSYGMSPGYGSPAIDGGNEALCEASPVSNLDQLGNPRPKDGDGDDLAICDIGALEIQHALKAQSIPSQGVYDGWVLESSENSNTGGSLNATGRIFRLGDDVLDRQYRAILSFDTSSLPAEAAISSAVLRVKQYGKPVGSNPFTVLDNLLADIKGGTYGAASLEATDFQASPTGKKVGTFGKRPSIGWYSARLNAAGLGYINKAGATQFRLYFAAGDNDNSQADLMRFFSGNNPTGRPELFVTYTLP